MTEQQPTDRVLIERDSAEVGKPGRVYVTGPHFGSDIFSSKADPVEATVYYRHEAAALVEFARKWRHLNPRIVDVPDASTTQGGAS